jgi:hypothetical protein
MIALMADPALMPLTNALVDDPDHRLWLLTYIADRFGLDDSLPPDGIGVTSVIPQFFGDTASTSGTCGCHAGSASPATTVPAWISLRCNRSGRGSWLEGVILLSR